MQGIPGSHRAVGTIVVALAIVFHVAAAHGGPHLEPGVPGFIADPGDPAATILNPELRAWAASVEEFNPAPGLNAANSNPAKALGPIASTTGGETVALGDLNADQLAVGGIPGSVTLSFAAPIRNGAGWDLAVFENSFSFFPPDDDKLFAELAYVEVSSDGLHFARFPSVSLTTPSTLFLPDFGSGPLRDFAGIDPTDIHNLAGRHAGLTGTPFDLAELAADPFITGGQVDVSAIRYVRIIDIPGNGQFLDSEGRGILDAWVTTDVTFGNGGFDLDAVGARYPVPEPATWSLAIAALLLVYRHRPRH